MSNPVLEVLSGGRGETPVPADAGFLPGQSVQLRLKGRVWDTAEIMAVVPAGVSPQIALADALNVARPLMVIMNRHRVTTYLVRRGADEAPWWVTADRLRTIKT